MFTAMNDDAATAPDFDFQRYVDRKKRGVYGGEEAARYAYSADIAMLRTFRRLRPVELAAAATVRAYKEALKNQYLGMTIKVGPRQFPRIHQIAEECASVLGVPVPTLYVANNPFLNAYTFGTDEDAMIVLHSALIDHFEEDELRFVIGHETGHIQNKHVVYGTVLQMMKSTAAVFLKWIVPPAEMALHAWFRRAEITCDRAGLLCTRDLAVGGRALAKLACGSQKLYEQLDIETYLEQFQEGQGGVGRLAEAFASHPFLPKRIEALRTFSRSEIYRSCAGLGEGGLPMEEVDRLTSEIIQIMPTKGDKNDQAGKGKKGGERVR